MKATMWLCIGAGGTAGGWLGSIIDHGNFFGLWAILLTAAGSLAGIWVAVKIDQLM